MFFRKKNEYGNYEKYKKGSLFKVVLKDYLVPQGLCYVEPYVFISCYSTNEENSRVCMFDKKGSFIRDIILDNKSHVGGISYDKKNSLIWICSSKGKVCSYRYQEFIRGDVSSKRSYNVCDSSLGGSILLEEGNMVCSYLTVYLDRLYVGSFNKKSNGLIKVFDIIREKESISLKYVREFTVPNKIQGIAFYKDDDITYVFLSKSYTRIKDSEILVYKYSENIDDYSRASFSFNLPPMLEQIVDDNGNLLLLFESFAKKYSYNARIVIDDIMMLDSNLIIEDFSNNRV